MDVLTLAYVTMTIYALILLFFIVAAIRIIWYLADIRMELRAMNDNHLTHQE